MKNNICSPCGESVAIAIKEGQNRKAFLVPRLPRLSAVLPPQGREMSAGFTLIELLVVVIIIAILAIVAWPQYKHAVLKSRFSTVMPVAKAIADAQEVHYLGNHYYVQEDEKDRLDVSFPGSGEDIIISLSTIDGYDYVRASHTKVPGVRYVRYQNYSGQFPGEIHCEAQDGNDDAQWVCKSIGGTHNDNTQVTSDGYIMYIVEGTGNGILPSENGGEEEGNDEPNACHEGDTAPASMPQITSGQTGATGTATCVNGKWKYVWSEMAELHGSTYEPATDFEYAGVRFDNYAICLINPPSTTGYTTSYGCAGSIYDKSNCESALEYGCANSTFTASEEVSGDPAYCIPSAANACANSTFENQSVCLSYAANGCAGSTFESGAACDGRGESTCSGAIIKSGGACIADKRGGCNEAIFDGGCCDGNCPSGSPRCWWDDELKVFLTSNSTW